MSYKERKQFIALMRKRYARMTTKKARSRVLDEFCEMTALSRKHAIRTLHKSKTGSKKQGRPSGETREGTKLLIMLWKLSDMLCGKLLKPVIPTYLDCLQAYEPISPTSRDEVLRMSASTIDRRLRKVKLRTGSSNRRRISSLKAHRQEVPLKIEIWPDQYPKRPGWVEVDTVAHCGGSMKGSFVWTLTITDVGTGWTRIRCVWNKGAVGVCDQIMAFIVEAPFDVIAMNSDNGGEFINGHLKREFSTYLPNVTRTRSRSYKKNDNAHVEQKNGVQVRQLFGYGRIDDESLIPLMNEICVIQELLKNLYTPTMRLISKRRDGSRYIKKYEKHPMTPAQRLLTSEDVSEENKDEIKQKLKENNVCELRSCMNRKLIKLAVALAKRSEDQNYSLKSCTAKKFTKKDRKGKRNKNKAKRAESKGIPTTN